MTKQNKSGSGAPIYKHEAKKDREWEVAFGDDTLMEDVENHVKKYIGDFKQVYHETISDLVHIDIIRVDPSEDRPFYTLVTMGMSARPMILPDGIPKSDFEYAELMICLPKDWPMDKKEFEKEENYWPIRWMKTIARMPFEYDTWVTTGHTIPNGEPPEPFSSNTLLASMLLLPPITVKENFMKLERKDGKVVNFYALVPIYKEEQKLKLDKGTDALYDGFEKYGVNELLDLKRPNTVGKKFLGIF